MNDLKNIFKKKYIKVLTRIYKVYIVIISNQKTAKKLLKQRSKKWHLEKLVELRSILNTMS